MYNSVVYSSPIGLLTLACSSGGDSLVGLWIEGQRYYGKGFPEAMEENAHLPIFAAVTNWLDDYFAGKKPDPFALPLAPMGGEFRQSVWKIIREIPYGEVITYGAIAKMLAARMGREHMSSQAVGGAVGHNPISIIIPCHRVVGKNGGLTGYSGGVERKARLLELEGAAPMSRSASVSGRVR